LSLKKQISFQIALQKAQSLCAMTEKCDADIRKKLFDWKLPDKDHDKIIESLKNDNFIDEKRYAILFAKDKFRYNKWGKIKIDFALKQKKISSENIKLALEEIPEKEYEELLKNELVKKIKVLKETNEYTIKSKLMRFASSRGFESGKVFDMVSSIMEMHKNK